MSTLEERMILAQQNSLEASFHLWQSIITINGFMITIFLGIFSLTKSNNSVFLLLCIVPVLLLITSSSLIISNFSSIRDGYLLISQINTEDHNNIDQLLKKVREISRRNSSNEKLSFILIGISVILLMITVFLFRYSLLILR